jgi:hypothetical protein
MYDDESWCGEGGWWYDGGWWRILCTTDNSMWMKNGQAHREDGPAVIWLNGKLAWWINDRQIEYDMILFFLQSMREII